MLSGSGFYEDESEMTHHQMGVSAEEKEVPTEPELPSWIAERRTLVQQAPEEQNQNREVERHQRFQQELGEGFQPGFVVVLGSQQGFVGTQNHHLHHHLDPHQNHLEGEQKGSVWVLVPGSF